LALKEMTARKDALESNLIQATVQSLGQSGSFSLKDALDLDKMRLLPVIKKTTRRRRRKARSLLAPPDDGTVTSMLTRETSPTFDSWPQSREIRPPSTEGN
jgi:hypothetical protein